MPDTLDLSPAAASARFRWARQRGQPAWLWPDVEVEAWREALHKIELVLRAGLSGQADRTRLEGDPAAVGVACYTSGVGPLLGYWHEQDRIAASADVAAVLRLHLQHNRLRTNRMNAAAVSIVEALTRQGIAVAVLKGAHTGPAYFETAGIRPASDIDLLVEDKDLPHAEALLRAAGQVCTSRTRRESSWRSATAPPLPRSLHLVHSDDPWSIDLHGSLNVSAGAGAPLARLDSAGPMSSQSRWALYPAAIVLDQPLLLLHLAVHAGAGLHNLSLLRLVELALVIRRDGSTGALCWDEFLATGARTESLGYAFPALSLCEALVPGTVPEVVVEHCAGRTPPAVRRLLARLTPATAQRIDRSSIAEHFMWTSGWIARLRQIASDIVPARSVREIRSIYERRAWALVRGKISP